MRVVVCRPTPKAIAALAAAMPSRLVITASQAFAAAPSGPAGLDPVRAAQDVFQDEKYWWKRIETRTVSTSWLESILKTIGQAIGNAISRLLRKIYDSIEWILRAILRRLFGLFTGDFSIGTVLLWVIVVALLAWFTWKLYPVIVRWLSGGAPGPRTQDGVTWQTLPESSDLFEQAGQAFRDGKHAEAIRLALLALIARLEKQGLLRYDTTRTNREYQKELRHSTELATGFGQLARIYERVWYGRMAAGRAEAEQAIILCGSMINGESPLEARTE